MAAREAPILRSVLVPLALTLLAALGAFAPAPAAADAVPDALCPEPLLGPLPAGEPAIGVESCVGRIRPGAVLYTPWGQCTMNWILRDDAGRLYAGTAGHCAAVGHRVSTAGVGEFGTMVARQATGPGRDWGWIRVDAAKASLVDPTLCEWGGPVRDAPASAAGPALIYGWGWGFASTAETRVRTHLALAADDGTLPTHFGNAVLSPRSLTLVGVGNPGDSGAPVMSLDGAPYGVLTHSLGAAGGGLMFGTQFDDALRAGEAALGVRLALVTSPTPVIGDAL